MRSDWNWKKFFLGFWINVILIVVIIFCNPPLVWAVRFIGLFATFILIVSVIQTIGYLVMFTNRMIYKKEDFDWYCLHMGSITFWGLFIAGVMLVKVLSV